MSAMDTDQTCSCCFHGQKWNLEVKLLKNLSMFFQALWLNLLGKTTNPRSPINSHHRPPSSCCSPQAANRNCLWTHRWRPAWWWPVHWRSPETCSNSNRVNDHCLFCRTELEVSKHSTVMDVFQELTGAQMMWDTWRRPPLDGFLPALQ